MLVVLRFEFAVAIPVKLSAAGVGTVEQLHEAHAILNQSTGEDAVFCEPGLDGICGVIGTVAFEDMCGFSAEVTNLWNAELHPGSQFVAGDACGELAIVGVLLKMACIHPLQQRAGSLVLGGADATGRRQVAHRIGGAEWRPLEFRREETRSPVVDARLRHAAWIGNRYEGRKVLVLAAKSITDPATHAGKAVLNESRREEILSRPVGVRLAGKRMNKGDIVRQFRQVRDQIGNHLASLAARPEIVLRTCQISSRSLKRHRWPAGKRLAVVPDQLRFVVPSFKLADGSGAENHEHVLRLRRKVRLARRIRSCWIDCWHRCCQQSLATEQTGECNRTQRGCTVAKKRSPVEQMSTAQ